MPYLRVFEFLHQKILQPGDAFEVENETVVSLEEAELNLGQLKKRYLHRAVLGMIEDMMYGGIVQEELLEDDLMEFVQGERDEHDLSIVH